QLAEVPSIRSWTLTIDPVAALVPKPRARNVQYLIRFHQDAMQNRVDSLVRSSLPRCTSPDAESFTNHFFREFMNPAGSPHRPKFSDFGALPVIFVASKVS